MFGGGRGRRGHRLFNSIITQVPSGKVRIGRPTIDVPSWDNDSPVDENDNVWERHSGSVEQAEEKGAAAIWVREELLELGAEAVHAGVSVAVRDEVHQGPGLC